MKWLMDILRGTTKTAPAKSPYKGEYRGVSDFLRNASTEKKIEVFTEAARRANEDQRATFERARAKRLV